MPITLCLDFVPPTLLKLRRWLVRCRSPDRLPDQYAPVVQSAKLNQPSPPPIASPPALPQLARHRSPAQPARPARKLFSKIVHAVDHGPDLRFRKPLFLAQISIGHLYATSSRCGGSHDQFRSLVVDPGSGVPPGLRGRPRGACQLLPVAPPIPSSRPNVRWVGSPSPVAPSRPTAVSSRPAAPPSCAARSGRVAANQPAPEKGCGRQDWTS